MSDLWAYELHKCDGDYCPYRCDRCRKAEEEPRDYELDYIREMIVDGKGETVQ